MVNCQPQSSQMKDLVLSEDLAAGTAALFFCIGDTDVLKVLHPGEASFWISQETTNGTTDQLIQRLAMVIMPHGRHAELHLE